MAKKVAILILSLLLILSTFTSVLAKESKDEGQIKSNDEAIMNNDQYIFLDELGYTGKEKEKISISVFQKLISKPNKEVNESLLSKIEFEKMVDESKETIQYTIKVLKEKGFSSKEIDFFIGYGFFLENDTSDYDLKSDTIEILRQLFLSEYSEDTSELGSVDQKVMLLSAPTRTYDYFTLNGAVPSILTETGASYVCFNEDVDFDSSLGWNLSSSDPGYYTRLNTMSENLAFVDNFADDLYGVNMPLSSYNYNVWGEITFKSLSSNDRHHEGVDIARAKGASLTSNVTGNVVGFKRYTSSTDYGKGESFLAILDSNTGTIVVYEHLLVDSNIYIGKRVNKGDSIGTEDKFSSDPLMAPHTHVEFHVAGGTWIYYQTYPFVLSDCYANKGNNLESLYPYYNFYYYGL